MQKASIINFQEAKDFGGKMNALYMFLRQNRKGIFKSLVFFAAPFILLSSALSKDLMNTIFSNAISAGAGSEAATQAMTEYFASGPFWLRILVSILISLVGGVFTFSTVFAYILVYEEQQSTSLEISNVWAKVKKLFWPNFGNLILYGCGFFLCMILLMIPMWILTLIATFLGPILIFFVMLAYYIFLIALSLYFSIALFIAVKEKTDYFTAIGRLINLAKNKFWNTVVFGGINFYLYLIFSSILLIPYYLYLYLVELHDVSTQQLSNPSMFQEIIGMVLLMVYSLASVLLVTLPLASMAVQYYYLAESKEAKGLLAKIERFHQVDSLTDEHEDF